MLTILTYHSVSDDATPLSVTPEAFAAQLAYLKDHRIKVVDLESYLAFAEGGKRLSGRNVLITFDDGYRDVYELAWPILKKYNFPAVMFVNSARVGNRAGFATRVRDQERRLCSVSELGELARGGMAIANHGDRHRVMRGLREAEIISEYRECHDWIKKNIPANAYPDVFALPKGVGDERVKSILRQAGARLIMDGRTDVYPDKSIGYFRASLNPVFRWLRKNKIIFLVLGALVLIKIVLGILLLSNIPNVGLPPNHFLPSGGDDYSYVKAAQNILQGQWFGFVDSGGYPLFIALVMLMTGLNSLPALAAPLIFANVFIFGITALVFSVLIVRHFWRKTSYAIFAGLSFIAVPYVWYAIFKDFVLVQVNNPNAIDNFGLAKAQHLFGLMALSDWLAFALTSAAFWLFLKKYYLLSGLIFGLAFLTRVQNLFPLFFLALALLLLKKYSSWLRFGVATLVTGFFPLVQNYILTGSIFQFSAYSAENNINTASHPIGFQNIIEMFPRFAHYLPLAIPFLFICLGLLFVSIKYFWHRKEALYFLLATGVFSPLMLFFVNSTARNPRYFLPFIPIFLVFIISVYEFLVLKKGRYNQ